MKSILHTFAPLALLGLGLAGCSHGHAEDGHHEEAHHPILVTSPAVMDVPTSRHFVCQIHSQRHIEVRALDEGYLQQIPVQEGQAVRQGQLLFKLLPTVYRARLDGDRAELHLAEINLRNTRRLAESGVVSDQELALARAERDRARAKVDLAAAEYGFTEIVAPFDGIMDRQLVQEGSLIEEGDILTTISNNEVMWVYFNVPEADYLRFKMLPGANDPDNPQRLDIPNAEIQLRLANGEIFEHDANPTLTIESDFDNETGNIKFRADFPNPERLLRHGQTGTLLLNETLSDAIVIPQRATFEVLDRQYVYVVDDDGVAHQREITVAQELEDIFVIADGLSAAEKLVFEGVRQVRDGEHLEGTEFVSPEEALSDLKHHAE
jgi:membrane fusion protein (multidrug efflux system)